MSSYRIINHTKQVHTFQKPKRNATPRGSFNRRVRTISTEGEHEKTLHFTKGYRERANRNRAIAQVAQ